MQPEFIEIARNIVLGISVKTYPSLRGECPFVLEVAPSQSVAVTAGIIRDITFEIHAGLSPLLVPVRIDLLYALRQLEEFDDRERAMDAIGRCLDRIQ